MNWFWHAIWIALVVIPATILWFFCVFDIFGRRDMGMVARVLWLLGILVVPFFGSLVYLLARPHDPLLHEEAAAARGTVTQQLVDLDRLRGNGVIDEREFQIAKADVLGVPMPRGAGSGSPAMAGKDRAGA